VNTASVICRLSSTTSARSPSTDAMAAACASIAVRAALVLATRRNHAVADRVDLGELARRIALQHAQPIAKRGQSFQRHPASAAFQR
jgi:hypothetical protein